MRISLLPQTAGLLLLLAGCSSEPEFGQVSGTVTVQGRPLANVLVTFTPDTNGPGGPLRSHGTTNESGVYALRTEGAQIGAVVGPHRVTVEDLAIYSAPRSEDGTLLARPAVRFSPKYGDLLQTPLRFDVRPGEQKFDLELSK